MSTAYTPHPCTEIGQHACSGDDCGGTYSETRYAGDCDPDGCDFNSYRQGVTDFYGPGMTVDTGKVFTVVTQFIKGSDGALESIKRYYVQDGKVIPNSESTVEGTSGNDVNTEYCTAQKVAFGDTDVFAEKGGLAQMGKALEGGMVLVMSLWDDVSFYPSLLAPPPHHPLRAESKVTNKTQPALRQHALARLQLPPGEGRHPRRRPWQLRPGLRRPRRCRVQAGFRHRHLQQHPLRSHQLHLRGRINGRTPFFPLRSHLIPSILSTPFSPFLSLFLSYPLFAADKL